MRSENTCGTQNKATRDEWLQQTLANIPSGSRILDAGAGELQYKPLCSHLNYVSQDFGQYDGKGDGTGLQTTTFDNSRLDIVCDITNIPEPDASFDAVMCIEVLEHIPYPVDALRELNRLLKPKGCLILTAPFCSLTHFAPFFYQTGYSRFFYEYWLQDLGYDILQIDHNGNYFKYLAQELRRLPGVSEQYANKPLRWRTKKAIQLVIGELAELSDAGDDSKELLSFGLHVLAKKQ